ncbi:hypothetical protein SADUNF_Sadunf06G0214100 [Salix dunnii]|uniref:R13L1/DRL21-like LRR repeat region domain-containing protein n=1 Tax=Salix dunnii TaxID=1413687 RepID=A0A835N3C6_9ROSI|nr:hypothetical protein SADUNF_Sadunf06G0214100 [Salix dunnii]
MEALPNSVTNLVNLQVLKLNGCWYLKELPRGINKLINLRHLDDNPCESLEFMPRGIGKLTSLQTLSCFVVAKNRSPKSEMAEFEGAKLEDKQYLQSLTTKWESIDIDTDMDLDIDLYDKMLQSLQPNSNLQELGVKGYGGMSFPSWLSDLSNLVRISLDGCKRLEHIPPLDGIPYLKELLICSMKSLEYIDSEGVGGKEVSKFFPSLKILFIYDCHRLKGWWNKSRGEMKDESDESTIEEEFIMLYFPHLSSLGIYNCPNLTSMPLFPTLDEDLWLWGSSSMPLQQTMKMKPPVYYSSSSSFIRPLSILKTLKIWTIDDMESLPEVGLQNLSSLQYLEIKGCSRLKSLPLHGQGMPSLQNLFIHQCPRLKSLPLHGQGMPFLETLVISECTELKSLSESKSQGMIPYLPSLQELRIRSMSEEMNRGWGKESEEVWPNIKHIPNIIINKYYIQREGRYVEGEGLRCKDNSNPTQMTAIQNHSRYNSNGNIESLHFSNTDVSNAESWNIRNGNKDKARLWSIKDDHIHSNIKGNVVGDNDSQRQQNIYKNGLSEELNKGWGKESEEVLPNIKQIPNIVIDHYYIQKEGIMNLSLSSFSIRSLEDEFLIYIARDAAEKVILQKFRGDAFSAEIRNQELRRFKVSISRGLADSLCLTDSGSIAQGKFVFLFVVTDSVFRLTPDDPEIRENAEKEESECIATGNEEVEGSSAECAGIECEAAKGLAGSLCLTDSGSIAQGKFVFLFVVTDSVFRLLRGRVEDQATDDPAIIVVARLTHETDQAMTEPDMIAETELKHEEDQETEDQVIADPDLITATKE